MKVFSKTIEPGAYKPEELLDALRSEQRADVIWTNYEGERVWLTKCPGGITDCCLASEPCPDHAKLTHHAHRTEQ